MLKKLLGLFLLLNCVLVQAQFFDGTEYVKNADSGKLVNRAISLGYVMGVYDTTKSDGLYCLSKQVPAQYMKEIVVKYLKDNPSSKNYPANVIIISAFTKKWPCGSALNIKN